MIVFDESRLREKLEHLAKERQLVFLLFLCERMLPALEKFSRETAFDSVIYRSSLNDVWHYLELDGGSSNYAELAEQCLDRAPDTEEFDHPLTSAALNAALSIAATLGFIADDDVDHAVEAAGLARDTAALYAQSLETVPPRSLGFDEVMRHPFVQHELRQQAEDLEFLEALPGEGVKRMMPLIKERAAGMPALLPAGNGR